MERLTYKQAYDLIIQAYFKNEIKPLSMQFCFCGTLAGKDGWRYGTEDYTDAEYNKMEFSLLSTIRDMVAPKEDIYISTGDIYGKRRTMYNHPLWEDALFAGMSAALDVLKQIHKERGEDVDEELKLTKRNLIPA